MSTTLFKKVDYSLSKLIHDIEQGEIGLPDIQRPFVWEAAKVRDYAKRFRVDELARMMKWHALPEAWETMGYTDFLAERRKLLAKVVREGFEKLLTVAVTS